MTEKLEEVMNYSLIWIMYEILWNSRIVSLHQIKHRKVKTVNYFLQDSLVNGHKQHICLQKPNKHLFGFKHTSLIIQNFQSTALFYYMYT